MNVRMHEGWWSSLPPVLNYAPTEESCSLPLHLEHLFLPENLVPGCAWKVLLFPYSFQSHLPKKLKTLLLQEAFPDLASLILLWNSFSAHTLALHCIIFTYLPAFRAVVTHWVWIRFKVLRRWRLMRQRPQLSELTTCWQVNDRLLLNSVEKLYSINSLCISMLHVRNSNSSQICYISTFKVEYSINNVWHLHCVHFQFYYYSKQFLKKHSLANGRTVNNFGGKKEGKKPKKQRNDCLKAIYIFIE